MNTQQINDAKKEMLEIKSNIFQQIKYLYYFKRLDKMATPYLFLNFFKYYIGYNGYTTKEYAGVSIFRSRELRFKRLKDALNDVYMCGYIIDPDNDFFVDMLETTNNLINKHRLIYFFL